MNNDTSLLWRRLRDADIVAGDCPEKQQDSSPWYIRVMLGITGWLAALFLLGFVAVGLQFIIENKALATIFGALVMVVAFALFRKGSNEFIEQFGLVLSLTGQALFLFGIIDAIGWHGPAPWFIGAGLQVIVIFLMANFLQRLLAGYFFIVALSAALSYYGGVSLALAFAALLAVLFWLNEFRWGSLGILLRPAAYGVTISLLQIKGQTVLDEVADLFLRSHGENTFVLPGRLDEVVLGFLLVAVSARIMHRYGTGWTDGRMQLVILLAAAVAAVSFEAPGISVGLTLILLGFGSFNRIVLGLGIASLLLYISAYYYSLETTLLHKSATLAATGGILLLVRLAVSKWLFTGVKEVGHE
ncbi:DUF4401 domain-containing protein [Desulfopila inferna]|uniref:DUF4401 domain-containing protein n=1 Tax=Desulfopila inferna TaxID=468528 RepID=UPI001965A91A|nr:DUF4401 domain-containing protein [Desulfopila inferna]MBM9603357.1 DUF4401 domain-containing protein [Desulfopila inferna]